MVWTMALRSRMNHRNSLRYSGKQRSAPIDRVGGHRRKHLRKKDRARWNRVGEQPLPHGVTAALEIELEPFSLENQHHAPPNQNDGAKHRWKSALLIEGGNSWLGFLFGNEILNTVAIDGVAKFLLDGVPVAAILVGDASRLVGIIARKKLVGGFLIISGTSPGIGHCVQKTAADRDFPLTLNVQAFPGFNGNSQHKCRTDI
jgi:hypothetical protein